jgi:pheromone shutdown protein TraB
MRRMVAVSLLWVVLGWSAAAVVPARGAEAAPSAPTEVVIIGTLHQFHDQNANYGPEEVRRILVSLHPSVICVELYSKFFTESGDLVESILEDRSCPEIAATNQAAKQLEVKQVPFDREGRNEFYVETKYFERLRRMNELWNQAVQIAAKADPDDAEVKSAVLLGEAGAAQEALSMYAPPEVINSEGFDGVIRMKRGLEELNDVLLAKRPGTEELTRESAFFKDEWAKRNGIMADNIARVAAGFHGKRIAVVTGAEHRGELRKLLAGRPGIVVKEFWEVAPRE